MERILPKTIDIKTIINGTQEMLKINDIDWETYDIDKKNIFLKTYVISLGRVWIEYDRLASIIDVCYPISDKKFTWSIMNCLDQ